METNDVRTNETIPAVELSIAESWALVREAVVGRVAVVAAGRPEIFPVNHVVDHGTVVFRTAGGTKLDAAAGKSVCFEVDGYDVAATSAWSVVVKGRGHKVAALDEVLEAMGLPLFPWHPGAKAWFVRIEPDQVTGRRFPVAGGYRGR